jgi:hypothetical protein
MVVTFSFLECRWLVGRSVGRSCCGL